MKDSGPQEELKGSLLQKIAQILCINRIEICPIPLRSEKNVFCAEYRLPFLAGFGFIDM